MESRKVMYALDPLVSDSVAIARDRGSPRCGLDSGGPAVVGPWGPLDRMTLRRHLSMALPLSKSRRIRISASSHPPDQWSTALRFETSFRAPLSRRRRQEVDRVSDRQ